jgi:hemerythrin
LREEAVMLEWRSEYEVGIKEIDRQHKEILGILKRLSTQRKDQERDAVREALMQLVSYIDRHFALEEELMDRHAYPGFDAQKDAHDAFVDTVCDNLRDFLKNRRVVPVNVFNFVWDWFSAHIVRMDRQYIPYLNEQESP